MDEAQIRLFVENLPAGAAFAQGTRVWFNNAAACITGYQPEDLTTFDDLIRYLFPDSAPQIREVYESAKRNGFAEPSVVPVIRKDGELRHVEFSAKAGPFGEIWLLRDVTDEQRLDRLREQIQNSAGMGGWELDCRTLHLYWSPEIYQLFEVDPREYQPQVYGCFPYLSSSSRERLQDAMKKAMEEAIPFDLELELTSAQGRAITMRSHCEVETDSEGKPVRLAGWCQDISAAKEVERDRRLLESQVRQAQKLESLSVLAGGIAHDFNNLLTTILGYTSLARLELSTESQIQEYLGEVEKASRRAADLTQQMLAYSGKERFVLVPVQIEEIVKGMIPLLNAAIAQRARLEIEMPGDLSILEGDVHQLRQVVMSLVCNAAEAIDKPEGRVIVRGGQRFLAEPHRYSPFPTSDPAPGWFIFLQVQDNGAGMSRDVLSRVFDPFFSTKFTGRGLGMAAVLGIVKGHKGLIHIESEVGVGTTVEILFPRATDVASPTAAPPPLPVNAPLILIVEDEENVRNLARQVLQSGGYCVITAADGIEAEAIFRQLSPTLAGVLLDMIMPRRDGEETLRILKQIDPRVPVFLMSGLAVDELSGRFANARPAGFIQKPFTRDELLAFLRKHFQTFEPVG